MNLVLVLGLQELSSYKVLGKFLWEKFKEGTQSPINIMELIALVRSFQYFIQEQFLVFMDNFSQISNISLMLYDFILFLEIS